jgi:hypothetical protein
MTKEVYKEGVGRGKEGGRERGGSLLHLGYPVQFECGLCDHR